MLSYKIRHTFHVDDDGTIRIFEVNTFFNNILILEGVICEDCTDAHMFAFDWCIKECFY